MKITKEQNSKLMKLDVSGWGGHDLQIATALGFTRESARFYDAVDADGVKYEKNIPILFFVHKDGKITDIYETNYKKLIKRMGMNSWDLKAITKLYKRKAISEAIQMKSPLNCSSIKTFTKIWERS